MTTTPGSVEDRIVLDSSALLAIYFGEPERISFIDTIFKASERWISSISFLESSFVAVGRNGPDGRIVLVSIFEWLDLKIIPFTVEHLRWALLAQERFGKGRHPARLNLCDCCSYALAKWADAPLLYKGDDFPKTDLELIPL